MTLSAEPPPLGRPAPPLGRPAPHAPSMAGVASGSAAVGLEGVSTGYGDQPALLDVTLTLSPGTLTAIVGPNGGGKSTLLKVICGLLPAWTGTVQVLGAPPGRRAADIAYVPQAESVDWAFPVSAADVVMMGRYARLGLLRRPGQADRDAVRGSLEAVGMAKLADRQVGALSGGQRRRVFLARALAAEPLLYLLDEPVTGVDATTQEDLMSILHVEAKRGRTVVATTHDLGSAAEHFMQIVAVNRTVVAQGDASLILDQDILLRTYGGHLVFVGNRMALLDDAHHHDQEQPGEVHHHDSDRHGYGPR